MPVGELVLVYTVILLANLPYEEVGLIDLASALTISPLSGARVTVGSNNLASSQPQHVTDVWCKGHGSTLDGCRLSRLAPLMDAYAAPPPFWLQCTGINKARQCS